MRVSELPIATPLDSNDVFLVVQDGVTKQITKNILETSLIATPLTSLIDEIDAVTSYVGRAIPGSLTSSPVWQVSKIVVTSPDIAIHYAGAGNFNQVWDDRLSLSYS